MEDIVDMQRFSYSEGASKFKLGQYYASFCQPYSHDDTFGSSRSLRGAPQYAKEHLQR